jgi:capsular polysaccharide transport system ATP-binding protein
MIELENVTKVYATRHGTNVVLNGITASFPALTSIGILGSNGAGKSTLMRLLAGAEEPDAGSVTRHGRVSWPIGFSGGFNGSLTGMENCQFVARIYGADIDEVVGFAMDFAELGDYSHMPVRTYSSGMRSRLAFAMSMAIDFDIYLVDEVTAVGDASFRKKCQEAFAERRDRSSVIMVSHSLGTIKNYCDRAAVLKGGMLYQFDTIAEAAKVYGAS